MVVVLTPRCIHLLVTPVYWYQNWKTLRSNTQCSSSKMPCATGPRVESRVEPTVPVHQNQLFPQEVWCTVDLFARAHEHSVRRRGNRSFHKSFIYNFSSIEALCFCCEIRLCRQQSTISGLFARTTSGTSLTTCACRTGWSGILACGTVAGTLLRRPCPARTSRSLNGVLLSLLFTCAIHG